MKIMDDFFKIFHQMTYKRYLVFSQDNELIYASPMSEELLLGIKEFALTMQTEGKINNIKLRRQNFKSHDTTYYMIVLDEYVAHKEYSDPFLRRVAFLFDDLGYTIVVLKNDDIIYRNTFTMNLTGMTKDTKDSQPLFSSVIKKDIPKITEAFNTIGTSELKLHFKNGNSAYFTLDVNQYDYNDDSYKIITATDISNLKTLEETAVTEKEYLNLTLESVSEGLIIVDSNNKITLFNHVASLLLGYTKEDVLNKDLSKTIIFTDENFNQLNMANHRNESIDGYSMREDGLLRNLSIKTSEITDINNNIIGLVIVLTDLSEVKRREEEILYLSYHDVLTGVYNRTFFEEEIRRMDNSRNLPLTIVMGDLNGLKLTNDVFGHHIGDELLRRSADILKQSVRGNDILARWGGDEFIILLPNTPDEQAQVIVDRITRNFGSSELQISNRGFSPSISLGYGVKEDDVDTIQNTISIAEKNMYKQKMLTKGSVYSSAVTSMKTVLYEKSNETEDHTNRLYEMCKTVGKKYNLSKDEHNDLQLFSMLHDIGKIGIDDNILKKPSTLNDSEWLEMKRHSEIGFRIAQAIPELKKVALLILHHHERFDGTGYPKGLSGLEIPLQCRILAVADAYDAMTNDRTYRKALTKEQAIKELKDNAGTQFDPDVVKVFLTNVIK